MPFLVRVLAAKPPVHAQEICFLGAAQPPPDPKLGSNTYLCQPVVGVWGGEPLAHPHHWAR